MTLPSTDKVTHKRVLKIAVPVVISNATVPILGAVDTGVVGQLGLAAPIGAVGLGAIIITAIYWLFGFLRMGTSGMTAQAIGAKQPAEISALLIRAILIGLGAGVAIILLQVPLLYLSFKAAPASAEVEGLARTYLNIRIYSAPAAIALFGIIGWLVAHERTGAVLVLQLWMNGLNIGLDLLFVLQLGWGVQGVAFATFIAEWTGLGLGLYLTRGAFSGGYWRDKTLIFARDRLARMATVNGDIMIRSVMIEAAFVSFLFFGSSFDDVTLAANQVLLQFLHITAYGLDGFAFAAEAFVGAAVGARDRGRLHRAVVLCSGWGAAICVVLALAFTLGGPKLIDVMATNVEVRDAARIYLPWMIAAPLVGVASWMLDGIFIGATRTREMRNMMTLSTIVYFGVVAILMPLWGNHGLWAALMVFFVVRAVSLGFYYPRLAAIKD